MIEAFVLLIVVAYRALTSSVFLLLSVVFFLWVLGWH